MKPSLFPGDTSFWYETLRMLGHTAYGGADIGEVITTAQSIIAGDYDSWHDEWLKTANRVADEAKNALAAGHSLSARDGLLRAANYYRCAEFYLHEHHHDPRVEHAYTRARECFITASGLFDPPIEVIEIPYEHTAATDVFFKGQPRPLFEHLTCVKTMLDFSEAEGAGAHCQTDAQR